MRGGKGVREGRKKVRGESKTKGTTLANNIYRCSIISDGDVCKT